MNNIQEERWNELSKIDLFNDGFVELIEWLGSDRTIAESARLCYLGESKGVDSDTRLIEKLIKNSHTSPFEQVEFRFLVRAPIFVARQWMRHRTWSYIEVSRRFTNKGVSFYIPDFLDKENSLIYTETVLDAYSSYKELLERGVKKEDARGLLPVSMYTEFYAKTDLHNLLHFLKLRRGNGAQYEISQYALAIEKLVEPIVPITMRVWKKDLLKNE